MIKVQFGSGENKLEGWQNLQERDADITKRLNFEDNSVDYILAEHVVEHVTPKQAWNFFEECYRILKPDGVVRILVPDVSKILHLADDDYRNFVKEGAKLWYPHAGLKWEDREFTTKDVIKTIIFCHGHQAIWNVDTLKDVMAAVGFRPDIGNYGSSNHVELNGVDGHWKMMGINRCIMESCVVEGVK